MVDIELVYKRKQLIKETEEKLKQLAHKHSLNFGWRSHDIGCGYYFRKKGIFGGYFKNNLIGIKGLGFTHISVFKEGYEKLVSEIKEILDEYNNNNK